MPKDQKKILTSFYLEPSQKKGLAELSKRTRVPVSTYVREGIDLVLKKYARKKS